MENYKIPEETLNILKDVDTTAADKLSARDRALKAAAESGLSSDKIKQLNTEMKNAITKGKLATYGPMGGKFKDLAKKAGRKVPGISLLMAGMTALTDSPTAAASEAISGVEEAIVPGGLGDTLGAKEDSLEGIIESPKSTEVDRQMARDVISKKLASDPVIGAASQEGYNLDANRAQMAQDIEDNPVLQDIRKAARREALINKIGEK